MFLDGLGFQVSVDILALECLDIQAFQVLADIQDLVVFRAQQVQQFIHQLVLQIQLVLHGEHLMEHQEQIQLFLETQIKTFLPIL